MSSENVKHSCVYINVLDFFFFMGGGVNFEKVVSFNVQGRNVDKVNKSESILPISLLIAPDLQLYGPNSPFFD